MDIVTGITDAHLRLLIDRHLGPRADERNARQFKTVWDQLAATEYYPHLHYHNVAHSQAVLAMVQLLYVVTREHDTASTEFYRPLLLAAAYHDADHTGRPDTAAAPWSAQSNIHRAMKLLATTSLPSGFIRTDRTWAIGLIEYTHYPHDPLGSSHPTFAQAAGLLRDADMLHGLKPGMGKQSLIGIVREHLASGTRSELPDLATLSDNQLQFIGTSYQPYTEAGAQVRAALWDSAAAEWRRAHEDFLIDLTCGENFKRRHPGVEYAHQIAGLSEMVATMSVDEAGNRVRRDHPYIDAIKRLREQS